MCGPKSRSTAPQPTPRHNPLLEPRLSRQLQLAFRTIHNVENRFDMGFAAPSQLIVNTTFAVSLDSEIYILCTRYIGAVFRGL